MDLGLAILLQVIWLIARSEAWLVCVDAAGGSVNRRRLYRASSVGYLGNLFNSHIGMGVRIAALRRSAPKESPTSPPDHRRDADHRDRDRAGGDLLVHPGRPLGLPWWLPLVFVGAGAAIVGAITRLSRGHREGFWKGLAVMRGLGMRNRIIALVVFATGAQVVRNWLVLEGLGVDVTVLDSVALLIGTAVLGLLPVGPTLGVATAIFILGTNGVAVVAAAGALLTATGAVGAVCFASWALLDWMRRSQRSPVPI